jgi:hypothetical protein
MQEQFPGAELIGEPKLKLMPGRDPAVVEIAGSVARSALASGGGIRTFPGNVEWTARMVPGGGRHGPLKVNVRPELEWSLEVDLERPPKPLPEAVDLETAFGSLRITWEEQIDGYRVEGALRFEPGLVAAEEVDGLREFLVAVERHLGRLLEAP